MQHFPKISVLGTFLLASAFSFLSVANAEQQPEVIAAPFVADEQPASANYLSNVASTGKRNPYFVANNSSKAPTGTYSGILLSSEDINKTPRGLESLSFSYKGSSALETMVEFTSPGRSLQRAFASQEPVQGEYKTVLLSRDQLGIPANS